MFVVMVGLLFALAFTSIASDRDQPPLPYYSEQAAAHSGSNVFINRHTGDGIMVWDRSNRDGTKFGVPVEFACHIEPGVETQIERFPAPRKSVINFIGDHPQVRQTNARLGVGGGLPEDLQNLRAFEGQPAASVFFHRAALLLAKKKISPKYPVDFRELRALAKTPLDRAFANSVAISFSSSKR